MNNSTELKIVKDGNCFFCLGPSFINLQESENYGFGGSPTEAVANYYDRIKKGKECGGELK